MGSVPTDELEHLDTLLLRSQAVDIKAAQAILADAALSVKERVTKLANSVDSERRHDMDAASMRDFSARGSFAEDAVCMAYGFLIGPLTVVSLSREGVLEGVSYYNPGILAAAAHHFVFNDVRKVHYEALLPLADPPCRGISCVLRVTAARECCDVCGLPLHGSCLRRHRPPCAAAAEVTAQIATQAAAAAALQAQGQGDDGDDCEGSPSDSEGTTQLIPIRLPTMPLTMTPNMIQTCLLAMTSVRRVQPNLILPPLNFFLILSLLISTNALKMLFWILHAKLSRYMRWPRRAHGGRSSVTPGRVHSPPLPNVFRVPLMLMGMLSSTLCMIS